MDNATGNRRLGLALSGGGFRASFFHVGAVYYLLLKNLLEQADDEIRHEDYVKLVQELEAHFIGAVQQNLRVRTFANPRKNLEMSRPDYSRSDAIGVL